MVTVYRLETKSGTGVYQTSAICSFEFDKERHPLPQTDSLLLKNLKKHGLETSMWCWNLDSLYFGFSSIEQLRSWFYNDDWFRNLSDAGIVLSIYEADEVYIGNSQTCFNRETAVLKSQNNLIDFFKL